MQPSGINWTEYTWNPWRGCTRISAGCKYCYAAETAHRRMAAIYGEDVVRWNGTIGHAGDRIMASPLRRRKPTRVFACSMSDFFHENVAPDWRGQALEVMRQAGHHTFQLLTKRPENAAVFLKECGPLPTNIWLGTTVERQDTAYRIDILRELPASVRWLSCEPLLGPLEIDLRGIDWLVAGGESGADFRPMDLDWARALRDQCRMTGVKFWFKQVAAVRPDDRQIPEDLRVREWPVMGQIEVGMAK